MPEKFFFTLLICVCLWHKSFSSDIIKNSFGLYNEGIIAAFGDFNSDELTDAFVIHNNSNLKVFIAYDKEPFFRPSSYSCSFTNFVITSIVPGDYDGDAYMDIMLTSHNLNSSLNGMEDIRILWGGKPSLNCSDAQEIKATVKGQPLVLDYNHNMILDLFGINSKNQRAFWIFNQSREIPLEIILSKEKSKEMKVPHSHSFIDINDDNAADLLITTKLDVEVWLSRKIGGFYYYNSIPLPIGHENIIFGQVLFLDVALSGKFYLVLPTCFDSQCINSTILIYDGNWHDLKVNFKDYKETLWRFVPPRNEYYLDAITMRSGDFNMDGYPDILVTLSAVDSNETSLFLLHNEKCTYPECQFQRTFVIVWDKTSSFGKNVVMGTFYDFYMDGVLDIIYVKKNVTTQQYSMEGIRNELGYDTNFIKVIVVTSLTNKILPIINGTLHWRTATFGTNLPGPRISYNTWSQEGTYRSGVCGQLPQSAYFSLQLPYSIFGLDRTPNFVDKLSVGLSGYSKSWLQIIPNSQIVIIPSPANDPTQWQAQLFVTPSKVIVKSVFVLTFIIIIITALVIYFQWKERNDHEDIIEIDRNTYVKV